MSYELETKLETNLDPRMLTHLNGLKAEGFQTFLLIDIPRPTRLDISYHDKTHDNMEVVVSDDKIRDGYTAVVVGSRIDLGRAIRLTAQFPGHNRATTVTGVSIFDYTGNLVHEQKYFAERLRNEERLLYLLKDDREPTPPVEDISSWFRKDEERRA